MLSRRLGRVVILVVVVALIGAAVALDAVLATRLALAIAVIVIPGAVVSRAVFFGSAPGSAEMALLVVSFGLAILTLGGLALNLLPGGLTIGGWLAYLAIVTTAGLAYVRIRRPDVNDRSRVPLAMAHAVAAVPQGRVRTKDVVLIGIALGIATLALGIARVAALTEPTPPFTQLWLLPDAYPPSIVEIGVRSAEQEAMTYAVELRSGPTVLQRWDVTLDPGGSWRMSVPVITPPTLARPLEARLILPGTSVPYRSVTLRDQTVR